jgi:hypothetical protein
MISFIVFACALGSAGLGIFTRGVLPEHHVNEDSKYIFKSGMGLLATLSALVLGLLIASAKSSYDVKEDEIKQGAVKIILLDRTLRHDKPLRDPSRMRTWHLSLRESFGAGCVQVLLELFGPAFEDRGRRGSVGYGGSPLEGPILTSALVVISHRQ